MRKEGIPSILRRSRFIQNYIRESNEMDISYKPGLPNRSPLAPDFIITSVLQFLG